MQVTLVAGRRGVKEVKASLMTTIAILGSGIMGSALSVPLVDNVRDVRLVGTHLDRDVIDSIKATGVTNARQRS
jgi:glycerol-3-phosphate dehydrogenase